MNPTCANATVARVAFTPLAVSSCLSLCNGQSDEDVIAEGLFEVSKAASEGNAHPWYLPQRVRGAQLKYLRSQGGPVSLPDNGQPTKAGKIRKREVLEKADEQRQAARPWTNWADLGLPNLDTLR